MIKKYIRGNAKRGDEVIKALEDLGGINKEAENGKQQDCVYYINPFGIIQYTYHNSQLEDVIKELFEEITLPEKKERFNPKTLQPFDRVLARAADMCHWFCDFFSYKCEDGVMLVGGFNDQCVPYNDDTKHLVGTTEEAPEFYRWWED